MSALGPDEACIKPKTLGVSFTFDSLAQYVLFVRVACFLRRQGVRVPA
jgi:hypothetical protein